MCTSVIRFILALVSQKIMTSLYWHFSILPEKKTSQEVLKTWVNKHIGYVFNLSFCLFPT